MNSLEIAQSYGSDMWRHLRGVLVFLLRLALLPLAAVFVLKLLILAGAWTLESLPDPPYAITAGLVFLVVLASGIWSLVGSTDALDYFRTHKSPTLAHPLPLARDDPASGRATAHCNACGKLNWADAPNCHNCRAQMPASHSGV